MKEVEVVARTGRRVSETVSDALRRIAAEEGNDEPVHNLMVQAAMVIDARMTRIMRLEEEIKSIKETNKMTMTLTQMAKQIYSENKARGWWSELRDDGEKVDITTTRDRFVLFGLVATEVNEMFQAGFFVHYDDKLPHIYGCQAELADVFIRALDLCGADDLDILQMVVNSENQQHDLVFGEWEMQCLTLFTICSDAMEACRKNQPYTGHLLRLIEAILKINELCHMDLFKVAAEKREFNKVRTDHSVEHRLGPDGKKV